MQKFSSCLILISALLLSASCETAQLPELTEEDLAELLPYVSLGRGLQASLDTTTVRVITDVATWTAYADSLQPLMPFTSVDFETEMVLLAAVDVNSGGYDLRFELLESLRDTVVATYRLFSPGSDCRPSFSTGVAFEAIRVERTQNAIRFVQIEEALDCGPK